MEKLAIVCRRDTPARIVAGAGQRGIRRALAGRLERAVDHTASTAGLRESDARPGTWRAAWRSAIAAPEADHGATRLRALATTCGRA